ncbi:MAG: hypothetical protein JWQ42_3201 [Edaphobacter sp.]|nr:hypothetical protein [Edaphobacter sp.]
MPTKKILVANLQRVVDFLKFAEAKNAALLALSSAWILATIGLECGEHSLPGLFRFAVPLALIFVLCAGILTAISFFPKIKLPIFMGGRKAGPHPKNLLFFGDIASMTVKTFAQEIRTRYYPDKDEQREEYLHDLTVQINVNSMITLKKMAFFKWGVGSVIAAGLCLLVAALVMAYQTVKGAA